MISSLEVWQLINSRHLVSHILDSLFDEWSGGSKVCLSEPIFIFLAIFSNIYIDSIWINENFSLLCLLSFLIEERDKILDFLIFLCSIVFDREIITMISQLLKLSLDSSKHWIITSYLFKVILETLNDSIALSKNRRIDYVVNNFDNNIFINQLAIHIILFIYIVKGKRWVLFSLEVHGIKKLIFSSHCVVKDFPNLS